MANKSSLLSDIENEVNDDDISNCNKQLAKPDRIGKYSVWICIVLFAIMGWLCVEVLVVDSPVHHPWYSKIPFLGEKLWQPPAHTQLPVVGQKLHDVGIGKFVGLFGGAFCGFVVGKSISALIRNGAKQDERNQHKFM